MGSGFKFWFGHLKILQVLTVIMSVKSIQEYTEIIVISNHLKMETNNIANFTALLLVVWCVGLYVMKFWERVENTIKALRKDKDGLLFRNHSNIEFIFSFIQ